MSYGATASTSTAECGSVRVVLEACRPEVVNVTLTVTREGAELVRMERELEPDEIGRLAQHYVALLKADGEGGEVTISAAPAKQPT